MVRQALIEARKAGGGYVLDGVPRTMKQARATYQIARELEMTANVALHLKADDHELMRRLLARAALERRSDDTEEVIRHRQDVYHEQTEPVIAAYKDRGIVVEVDGLGPVDEVSARVRAALTDHGITF